MSAHLTENKSISRLAATIIKKARDSAAPASYKPFALLTHRKLARQMYDLNCKSLQNRYPDDWQQMVAPFVYVQNTGFDTDDANDMAQYYNSLAHFLYQSCEGDADKSELYEQIKAIKNEAANRIAHIYASSRGALWE